MWRRGSVVGSWLLDLAAMALAEDPQLSNFTGDGAGFRRGTLDHHRRAGGSGAGRRAVRHPSIRGSGRGGIILLRRRFFQPCETSSAVMSNGQPEDSELCENRSPKIPQTTPVASGETKDSRPDRA